jgi:hypothetical protein
VSIVVLEREPIEVLNHPYPYRAAFTVSSDIDSGSITRFRAVHALFCGEGLIEKTSPEWRALGLTSDCPRFDKDRGGVRGLGLQFADSFFLVGDATTFGMHRYRPNEDSFHEDEQDGENCATLIRHWLKEGQIDSFHAFLHYTRRQVEPLLQSFFSWCECENIAKPRVWINHSTSVNPTGLCPDRLQPSSISRLARSTVRYVVGPLFGRTRRPLRSAFVRYRGDTPGSSYYVNDLLAPNGLRYVWLNISDLHRDRIALPEAQQNGRQTILQPVTMDDGIRYWRFERCFGRLPGPSGGDIFLRDSKYGHDASHLITETNLEELCRANGTCILHTHWTHFRSMPIAEETIARFELLRRWGTAGKIWLTSTARLLEWTRRRTFLSLRCSRESNRMVVNIDGVDDPIFGRERLVLNDLQGLSLRLRTSETTVVFALHGQMLSPEHVHRAGSTYWFDSRRTSNSEAGSRTEGVRLAGQPTG